MLWIYIHIVWNKIILVDINYLMNNILQYMYATVYHCSLHVDLYAADQHVVGNSIVCTEHFSYNGMHM